MLRLRTSRLIGLIRLVGLVGLGTSSSLLSGCCVGDQRCTSVAGSLGATTSYVPRVEPSRAPTADGFPKWLVDPLDGRRELKRPPRRVVSTVLLADELLAELLEPERLVGVSRYVDEPTDSVLAGRVGPNAVRLTGEIESILSLSPEIAFVASFSRAEMVLPLAAAGVPVVRFDRFGSLADLEAAISLTGAVLGVEPRAATLVTSLKRRLARVAERARGHALVRLLIWQPGSYTYGDGTLADELVTRAGGRNVASELGQHGSVPVAVEQVLGAQPDVIVVSVGGDKAVSDATAELPDTASWRGIRAVRDHRVVGLPGAWLGSVSHVSVCAAEALAALLAAATTTPGALDARAGAVANAMVDPMCHRPTQHTTPAVGG